MEENKAEEILEYIIKNAKEGKIVCMTIDGLREGKLEDMMKQPIEGLLYDLNRDKASLYTLAKSSKSQRWVNDLATVECLIYLYNQNKTLKEELENIKKIADTENKIKADKKEVKTKTTRNNSITTSNIQEGFDTSFTIQL